MQKRKIPLRTCIITRESLPKQELIRIVRTPDAMVKIDLTGKMNGRGAYVKREKAVITKAQKSRQLERHLSVTIPEEIYLELQELID